MARAGRIDSREELILALQEAARVEHGLLVQYLFAALSLKRTEDEGLAWDELEMVNGWKADLLRIAKDEMGHLGTVMNALSSVGGFPSLQRPRFPSLSEDWFPVPFSLNACSLETLQRFVRFESPKPRPRAARRFALDAPELPHFEFVGELYRSIRQGFVDVGGTNPALFVGRPGAQDPSNWGLAFPPRPITSVAQAKAAIDALVKQGEGTPRGTDPLAHFATFRRLVADYEAAIGRNPEFVPHRPVVDNPVLRPTATDAVGTTVIPEDVVGFDVGSVHSSVYILLLQVLQVYYDPVPEENQVRGGLQNIARQLMMGLLRPLGEVLTLLPATDDPVGPTCGPSFELFGDIALSTDPKSRWTLMHERIVDVAAEMQRLVDERRPELQRLAGLMSALQAIVARFATIKEMMDA
jgi:hypothetical protein